MIYGYARVSTELQKIERQIHNLEKFSEGMVIYREKFTGTTQDRREFQRLLKVVNPEDTIVFDSISRMSRNAAEGQTDYFELMDEGIKLVFLKEAHINSELIKEQIENSLKISLNAESELIKETEKFIRNILVIQAKEQVRQAFEQSEKEVEDLRVRTKEGIERARAAGKRIGTQKGDSWTTKRGQLIQENLKKHSRAFGGSMTDKEFMEAYRVSKPTLVKYKRKLREEA